MDLLRKRKKLKDSKNKGGDRKTPSSNPKAPVTRIGARKNPRQERSKVMVEAILEAATQIFAEMGYARATTNKIAERAGVSVGSLYQYFPNKDSLIARLHEMHQVKIHKVIGGALKRFGDHSMSLEEGLRRLLDDLHHVHEANPTLSKALSWEVMRESKAAEKTHKDKEEDLQLDRLTALIFNRPDVRDDDPKTISVIMGQIVRHLTRWLLHDAPQELNRETLMEETVQLLYRYLRK